MKLHVNMVMKYLHYISIVSDFYLFIYLKSPLVLARMG
jgi:hypothetical protein